MVIALSPSPKVTVSPSSSTETLVPSMALAAASAMRSSADFPPQPPSMVASSAAAAIVVPVLRIPLSVRFPRACACPRINAIRGGDRSWRAPGHARSQVELYPGAAVRGRPDRHHDRALPALPGLDARVGEGGDPRAGPARHGHRCLVLVRDRGGVPGQGELHQQPPV